jgi:hypothetical protein
MIGNLTFKGNRITGIPTGSSQLLNKAPSAQPKVVPANKWLRKLIGAF